MEGKVLARAVTLALERVEAVVMIKTVELDAFFILFWNPQRKNNRLSQRATQSVPWEPEAPLAAFKGVLSPSSHMADCRKLGIGFHQNGWQPAKSMAAVSTGFACECEDPDRKAMALEI